MCLLLEYSTESACQFYHFNVVPIKISLNFFMEIDKLTPKLIWKCKETGRAETNFKKKKVGVFT